MGTAHHTRWGWLALAVVAVGVAVTIAVRAGTGEVDPGGLVVGLVGGLVARSVVGLVVGLVFGFWIWSSSGRRYLVFLCCCRGRLLPWRLGAFLNWAYDAGLLRVSGIAYQFRHRELQDWLAANPTP